MSIAPPFSLSSSPNFAELLHKLNCTLLLSTFQAGKVILISAQNEEQLIQLPRTFDRPMGVAVRKNEITIACSDQLLTLKNDPKLSLSYPSKTGVYDAMFLPRKSLYTGRLDIHDIHYGSDGHLYGVNTLFSCLCRFDQGVSITPVWKPKFIKDLQAIDACHLNGLAMQDGVPTYITALGKSCEKQGWRSNIPSGGILIHIPSQEIICDNLSMPHSPRWYNGKLYLLCSASEKLLTIDPDSGKSTEVCHVPGFIRGMTEIGDYVFIASSKLRKNSSLFKNLSIADKANKTGVTVIHLPTGVKVAEMTYHSSVDEIYDISLLPEIIRPNILNSDEKKACSTISSKTFSGWVKASEDKAVTPQHTSNKVSIKIY